MAPGVSRLRPWQHHLLMSLKRATEMRAAALDRFGGVETIQMKSLPVPELGPDEVLLRVEAAGGGVWDPYEREGEFAKMVVTKPRFPYVLGSDGVALAKRLGADAVVNGRKDDVEAAARAFAPGGLDAALVTAGGEATDRALLAMHENGRVAHPNGVMPAPKARPGVKVQSYDLEPRPEQIERLNRLIESGPFEVHVARTVPLDRGGE